ncbi:hypothetical protein MAPG_07910 [Magnaporthiopsis poae ATCC 64411]|uniref:Uncharacterized protein n=1 Tax=Magnaporthiopsis poae (strain ATCC 64411 / 73-15) TaxID=644358 RepID=A0A0C4E5Y1_MAGP6|nr:hypothetical protein MAPG_07910 [Magnaporthiopsis poae ATCC 64411]
MRYPSISAFILANAEASPLSPSIRLDSPSETGGHVSRRRLVDELNTPIREELAAMDAEDAGAVDSSNNIPTAQDPPVFILRRTDSDGHSVSSSSSGSTDLASILAVSGGSSVYERSIDERADGAAYSAAMGSWASRRRRSLSALVRRAWAPALHHHHNHHGQDAKQYRHSISCERPAEGEASDQQIRSLVSNKPTFDNAVKAQFYSQEAKRGVAGWVSRRRARSTSSA